MHVALAVILLCFLAFANGANDNFKGVATLFGSGTSDYKRALAWATLTTALGSLAALVLAKGLLVTFSGKGVVPTAVLSLKSFPLAVGFAAAVTVMLATRFGFPISTTHALVGGLAGAGLVASSSGIQVGRLIETFFLPLVISPFIAILGTAALYPALRKIGRLAGIRKQTCLCVGTKIVGVVPQGLSPQQALMALPGIPEISLGTEAQCVERYQGRLWGMNVGTLLDKLHYVSAGAVGFARGLNDTPKIAALLLTGNGFGLPFSVIGVGALMAVGGILSARKVAHTMSLRITDMNHAQGFAANLVTGFLVIFASEMGMPVSTTHVSCGSLFGIGAATGTARWRTIAGILASWVITLPVAAVLGGLFFWIFRNQPLLGGAS
ncbi:MAG TPA: inorganic phosphate transporter [bacterium]|nr:inorganic phosphate transporter [bacterium]